MARLVRSAKLMGFQFTEVQQLALFARYDSSCGGEVDYTEFVSNLMESDFKGVMSTAQGGKFLTRVQKTFSNVEEVNEAMLNGGVDDDEGYNSELDQEEMTRMNKIEVQRIFTALDADKSGEIDRR